jgi:uncharacterized protein (TIGR02594 family)
VGPHIRREALQGIVFVLLEAQAMKLNTAIDTVARGYLGLKEWPGAKHNPAVVALFAKVGHAEIHDDETPWCAAFVGAVLAEAGARGTGALNARSYMKWGEAVDISDAQAGDVVVFWRGSRDGWQGHVAFFVGFKAGQIEVLGGNQGNAVSIAHYASARLLGIRRMKPARTTIAATSTMQASATTIGASLGTAVTAVSALDGNAQYIVLAFAGIIVIAGLWIMRERIKKYAAGDR